MCAVHCQQLQLAVEVILGEFKQAKSAEQKVLHRFIVDVGVVQWNKYGFLLVFVTYMDQCQPFGVTVSDDFKLSVTS